MARARRPRPTRLSAGGDRSILVVDDHPVVREGLRALLGNTGRYRVAVVPSGEDALAALDDQAFDLALVDLSLPGLGGVDVIAEIRSRHPSVATMAFSFRDGASDVLGALRAGARGYALKDASPEELLHAVDAVAAGGVVLPGRMAAALSSILAPTHGRDEASPLSPREREVVCRIARGETNKEIAAALSISPRTVEAHRARISAKLGIRTVAEASSSSTGSATAAGARTPRLGRGGHARADVNPSK